MMKLLFLLLLSIFSFNLLWAQDTSPVVTAKITLGEVEGYYKNKDKDNPRSYHYILVSFINHSNEKIYIPDMERMLLESDSCQCYVVYISRNDSVSVLYPDANLYYNWRQKIEARKGLFLGSFVPGFYRPFDLFSRIQTKMHLDKYKRARDYTKKHKQQMKKLSDRIGSLADCLYLKPHEEQGQVYVIKANRIFHTPGHYKVYYKPMLDSSRTAQYPDEIDGFKKLIPQKILSNVLYFDVKKKTRFGKFL